MLWVIRKYRIMSLQRNLFKKLNYKKLWLDQLLGKIGCIPIQQIESDSLEVD